MNTNYLAKTATATPAIKNNAMPSKIIIMQPEPPDGAELDEEELDDEPDEGRDLDEEELDDEEPELDAAPA